MSALRPTLGLRVWAVATTLAGPAAEAWLSHRAQKGKEDPERLNERRGMASQPRPDGPLVWLHAASVGESQIALSLAEALTAQRPALHVLITSGTRTSARLIAARAMERVIHQMAPADRPAWTRRFIAYWRPQAGVFLESELWPNLIRAAADGGVPIALANARMNERSLGGWARMGGAFRALTGAFEWIGAADLRTGEGLERLTGRKPALIANLKLETGGAPPDSEKLAAARAATGSRPVFTAASTHQGEEAILARAHARILQSRPDALMILAPRHPERASAAAAALSAEGLAFVRRSKGETPATHTPVWLADTLGEMGLWLELSPAAFIGGSLIDKIGGHNPVEAARAGAAVLTGPHTASFDDIYAALRAENAVLTCADADAIASAVLAVWDGGGPERGAASRALARLPGGALTRTCAAILSLADAEPRS